MDRMLYLGMTGAKHTQQAQATTVNNLANASTPGFRGDFHRLLTANVDGAGTIATRANSIAGERASNLETGSIISTGNPLDVAINGDAWLAVEASDGSEAYTRRGDLRINSDGLLTNGAGQLVLGDGGPVALPPHQSVSIAGDGTVSIVPLGNGPETSVVLDRLRLVTLDDSQVIKGDDGLMRQRNGQPGAATASARLQSGSLESSNVSAVESMVAMIDLSRQYEMQVKMMQTAKEISDSGARLMRLE